MIDPSRWLSISHKNYNFEMNHLLDLERAVILSVIVEADNE